MGKTCRGMLVVLFIVLVTAACNKLPEEGENQKNSLDTHRATPEIVDPDEEAKDAVEQMINNMTLEEKVGQVFIMSLRNFEKSKAPVLSMNEDVQWMITRNHLGGVILFGENIDTIPQTKKLIEDMQSLSRLSLFIAVDEEGGRISRLNKSAKMHATKLPAKQILGSTEDTGLAEKVGQLIGREIASLGFNMNLAPVADVNTNPQNPVIGNRSFGSNPWRVAQMVQAELQGMQQQNVATVLKHFPGHGDTSLDSHTGAVVIEHGRKRLEQVEFVPFIKGIEAGADGVMTAHIKVPALTQNDLPATLSKKILTGILREEMGFEGAIITDALEMGAISQYWSAGEAAVLAFQAGADILLIPPSIEEAYQALLHAVQQGEVTEERLDASVRRILRVKQKRGILAGSNEPLDPEQILGCEEHLEIVEEILQKAK